MKQLTICVHHNYETDICRALQGCLSPAGYYDYPSHTIHVPEWNNLYSALVVLHELGHAQDLQGDDPWEEARAWAYVLRCIKPEYRTKTKAFAALHLLPPPNAVYLTPEQKVYYENRRSCYEEMIK